MAKRHHATLQSAGQTTTTILDTLQRLQCLNGSSETATWWTQGLAVSPNSRGQQFNHVIGARHESGNSWRFKRPIVDWHCRLQTHWRALQPFRAIQRSLRCCAECHWVQRASPSTMCLPCSVPLPRFSGLRQNFHSMYPYCPHTLQAMEP